MNLPESTPMGECKRLSQDEIPHQQMFIKHLLCVGSEPRTPRFCLVTSRV